MAGSTHTVVCILFVNPQSVEYHLQMGREVEFHGLDSETVVETDSDSPKGIPSSVTSEAAGEATYLSIIVWDSRVEEGLFRGNNVRTVW